MIGTTLAVREPFLHFPVREVCGCRQFLQKPFPVNISPLLEQVRFGPTPIGLAQPQRHSIELPNYAGVPLKYEVITKSLDELNAKNFGFPIMASRKTAMNMSPLLARLS